MNRRRLPLILALLAAIGWLALQVVDRLTGPRLLVRAWQAPWPLVEIFLDEGEGCDALIAGNSDRQVWWRLRMGDDGWHAEAMDPAAARAREQAYWNRQRRDWNQGMPERSGPGWWRLQLPDVDGDGRTDWLGWQQGVPRGWIGLSRSRRFQQTRLPGELREDGPGPLVGDLDADGQPELILSCTVKDTVHLLRGWAALQGWRWDLIPFPAPERGSLERVRIGGADRILILSRWETRQPVEMIWRAGDGWRRSAHRFEGYPLWLWHADDGEHLVVCRCRWASDHSFYNRLRLALKRGRGRGWPFPLLPEAWHWAEVWGWDEGRSGWRRRGSFPLGGYLDLSDPIERDLNGDGRVELLLAEGHMNTFATLVARVDLAGGRHRYRARHLWRDNLYGYGVHALHDGRRTWIVAQSGERVVKAWTLE